MLIPVSEAARMAGVHRQTIYDQREKNPHLSYFKRMDGGKIMVETDDPLWRLYLQKAKGKTVDIYAAVGKILVSVLKEKLDIDRDSLLDILDEIDKRFKNAVAS